MSDDDSWVYEHPNFKAFLRVLLDQAEHEIEQHRAACAELREKYRPETIEVLLIGESPPAVDIDKPLRFFYAPTLARHDNLYRGVAEAVYGNAPGFDVRKKQANLAKLQADGFWLIDAVEYPINRDSDPERRESITRSLPGLVKRCQELAPRRGVIICHGGVYEIVADRLRAEGSSVLHDEPLPFPLPYLRARFVEGARAALGM